jgi:hypothetical protein
LVSTTDTATLLGKKLRELKTGELLCKLPATAKPDYKIVQLSPEFYNLVFSPANTSNTAVKLRTPALGFCKPFRNNNSILNQ